MTTKMTAREQYKQAYRLARMIWQLDGEIDEHCLDNSIQDVVGRALTDSRNRLNEQLRQMQKGNMDLYFVQQHFWNAIAFPPRNSLLHEMCHSENPPEQFKRLVVRLHREGKLQPTAIHQAVKAERDERQ